MPVLAAMRYSRTAVTGGPGRGTMTSRVCLSSRGTWDKGERRLTAVSGTKGGGGGLIHTALRGPIYTCTYISVVLYGTTGMIGHDRVVKGELGAVGD